MVSTGRGRDRTPVSVGDAVAQSVGRTTLCSDMKTLEKAVPYEGPEVRRMSWAALRFGLPDAFARCQTVFARGVLVRVPMSRSAPPSPGPDGRSPAHLARRDGGGGVGSIVSRERVHGVASADTVPSRIPRRNCKVQAQVLVPTQAELSPRQRQVYIYPRIRPLRSSVIRKGQIRNRRPSQPSVRPAIH